MLSDEFAIFERKHRYTLREITSTCLLFQKYPNYIN